MPLGTEEGLGPGNRQNYDSQDRASIAASCGKKNYSPVDTEKAGRSARPGNMRVRILGPLEVF